MPDMTIDPNLDLVLERSVDVPRELIWKAWTTPEHLKHWFCPLPWKTVECEIDLRPGGIFRTVMQSPDGERHDNSGCYLQVTEPELLVWTDALLPGFRPKKDAFMTACLKFETQGSGTRYSALVLHASEADRMTHEQMGFHDGWGTVVDQLTAYISRNLI